jgi:hypothetical protein
MYLSFESLAAFALATFDSASASKTFVLLKFNHKFEIEIAV